MNPWPILRLALGLSTLLLSAGCASPTTPPTAAPTLATATVTLPPTATSTTTISPPTLTPTPRPSRTPQPTLTPQVALQTTGPYFIYKKLVNQQPMLVIMDADGRGRIVQPLPTGARAERLTQAVSPDGRWLAFYTGTAGGCFDSSATGPFDLALNLLDLTTGQTQLLTPLLSADYPANFTQAAAQLAQQGVTLVEDAGIDPAAVLRQAFTCGIESLSWSPDGRYLAFAGQMDGLSSDLYVYDQQRQTMHRLSDGAEQIQSIAWSPDGRWILHGSANVLGEGMATNYHAAALDGSVVKTLSSSVIGIADWSPPATYLQSNASNGIGDFNLRSVNIETGQTLPLWKGAFLWHALDPVKQQVLVAGYEIAEGESPLELNRIDLHTGGRRPLEAPIARAEYLGFGDKRFFATGLDNAETFFVLADGTLQPTGYSAGRKTFAPDGTVVLVFGETLQVYTLDNVLVQSFPYPGTSADFWTLSWRPDSAGLFYTQGDQLYAVDLAAGETYNVDNGVPTRWEFDYTWATGH